MSLGAAHTQDLEPASAAGQKWLVVWLLSAGLAVDYLTRLGLYSVLPVLRKEMIASDLALGLLASSFPWTYGALSPVAGYVGDRFSRRGVLIASLVCWSIATALCGAATAAWQLIAMRVILAIGQVCYMPTAQAMIADFHGSSTRAKASGLYQAGSYVGIFLAGLPVAFLATHLGWRRMLLICGTAGLVLAVLMWKRLPSSGAAKSGGYAPADLPSVRSALALFRKPSLLLIAAAFSFAGITFWVLFTYLPMFVFDRYRLSLEAAAFQATFYMQFSAMVIMPVFGAVSDRLARGDARRRFLVCAIVSMLGIPALLAIGQSSRPAILIGGLVLFGIVMAGTDASWLPMLCNVTTPRQRATAYGILNTCGTLAGGMAAMLTAVIMSKVGLGSVISSLGLLFFLMAVLLILAGYVLLRRDAVGEDTRGLA